MNIHNIAFGCLMAAPVTALIAPWVLPAALIAMATPVWLATH